jgi:hypothetical protein
LHAKYFQLRQWLHRFIRLTEAKKVSLFNYGLDVLNTKKYKYFKELFKDGKMGEIFKYAVDSIFEFSFL